MNDTLPSIVLHVQAAIHAVMLQKSRCFTIKITSAQLYSYYSDL